MDACFKMDVELQRKLNRVKNTNIKKYQQKYLVIMIYGKFVKQVRNVWK